MTAQRHNLFQFWNTPEPPTEVAVLMQSWAEDPDFTYRRYDSATAEAYIAEHFDARAVTAYRQCAVPAMQADFFRYCALYNEGGVYVDAGAYNGSGLADYIAEAGRGMLTTRQDKIPNGFLFVRAAGDILFQKVIDQAISNIEGRISNNVWLVTGPGIMGKMQKNPAQRPWFDGFDIRPFPEVRKIVQFHQRLAYKVAPTDWRQYLEEGAPSIFRDTPES